MGYRFKKLSRLHDDMRIHNRTRDQFNFTYSKLEFDVIFLIDRTPFELLVGVKERQFAFTLLVTNNFYTEIPDQTYYQLCRILNLNYSKDKFSSFVFLQYIDEHTPEKCRKSPIEPHEIAYYKRDIPESDKIYFCGWIDHCTDGRRARNIEKTRSILGDAVADFCEKNNISSCWTSEPKEKTAYRDPPNYCQRGPGPT